MTPAMRFLLPVGLIFLARFLAIAITSLLEGRRRAALPAALLSVLTGLGLALAFVLPAATQRILAVGLAGVLLLFFLWLIWPFHREPDPSPPPRERLDERTIMFARARCMAVCPYAHPDTLLHNLIRFGVANSANFRKAAAAMDDLFYGKKPRPHASPKWVQKLYKR